MSDALAKLKQSVDTLEAASKAGTLSDSANQSIYQSIIQSIKGSNEEKILACVTLPLYYQSVNQSTQDSALNALLDLVEDADQSIRIKAINQLKVLCQNNQSTSQSLVPRIADVLTQLFIVEDKSEQSQVRSSMDALMKIDPVNVIIALINQLINQTNNQSADDKMRKLILEYFTAQMKNYRKSKDIQQSISQSTPQLQAELANKVKLCLAQSTSLTINEFKQMFTFLLSLKFLHTDPNYQTDLAAILHNQSVNQSFNPSVESTVDGWLAAARCIQSTKNFPVDRSPFMKYFVEQIAPHMEQSTSGLSDAQRLNIARSLPSISQSNNRSVDPRTLQSFLDAVWKCAIPLLPTNQSTVFAANEASRSRFSVLEGYLVACHLVCAQSPESAKNVLGLFVPTGQPNEQAALVNQSTTQVRMKALIDGLKSWSTNIKAEINKAQAVASNAKSQPSAPTAQSTNQSINQVGLFKSDFRVYENLLMLSSAWNEKLPTFISTGQASWRKESKDSVREKKATNQSTNQSNNQSNNQAKNKQGNQSTNQPKNNKRKNDDQNEPSSKKRKSDNHSTNQSTNQQNQSKKPRNNQSTNQSMNQPMNQSMNQQFNPLMMNPMMMQAAMMAQMNQFYQQSLNQPINQSTHQSTNQSGRGKQNRQTNNQSTNQRSGGQQNARKRGRQ